MTKIHCQCSNCGKQEQTSAMVGVPHGMYYLGYRANGDALYCPDCVKSWKERNGKEFDEQYKDPPHLFAMWWNKQVEKQAEDKSKIRRYRENAIGDYVDEGGGKTVMTDTNKPCCPMSFNVPPNVSNDSTYDCVRSRCAWWCEDAQKCALLVLAETQRKAVKK